VDPRKDAARTHFDRRAGRWERDRHSRWIEPVPREAFQALELEPSDRLLDVGCGTGPQVRDAAPIVKRVVGIDLSTAMIREAAGLAADVVNASFAVADSERLPFADGTFTAVLCSLSFHHYPDPERGVGEMARVLAPGGRLVIGDACGDLRVARVADRLLRRFEPGHVRLYRSSELGAFMHGAGFSQVELKRLSNGAYAIVRGIRP
jgi:ubiquinone/menaquinone biosynthesis C-methylase UbiE